MDTYIRIKNWNTYQHYKHRRPPWIKLHTSLLEDYEFECLQDASKLQLIAIWLVASRSKDIHADGDPLLPDDEDYITKKAGLKQKVDLQPLIDSGFIIREAASEEHSGQRNGTLPRRKQSAGRTLSSCKQVVPPETETEGRGERAEEDVDIKGENSLVGQGRRPRLPRHQKSTPQPPNPQPQGWGVDPAYPGDWDESYSGGVEIPSRNSPPVDALGNPYPHPRDLFDLWNEVVTCLPVPRTLTDGRARKAKLRLKEQPDLNYWRNVFTRMNRIPFLRGEGERGWKATFDWIVKDPINSENVMAGAFGKPKVEYEVVSTTESKPDGRIFEIQDEAGRSFKFLWYRSEPPHEKLIEALLTGARPCNCCGLPYEKGSYFLDNDKKYAGNESDISDWLQEKLRYHYGPTPDGHCPVCWTPLNEDGTCPGILPPGEQEDGGYHSDHAGRDMRSVIKWPFKG